MAGDELSDDERELIRQHREAAAAAAREGEADLRVWIRSDDGNEADIPYSKGRRWLQDKFGIDLDDEPAQDPAADAGKGKGKAPADPGPAAPGGEVRRFGRRMA